MEDTIIIGGGMSALGCARRLMEEGKTFKMITPEIGGRVRKSPDGKVNYGAYYVTADYENTLPFCRLTQRVQLTDCWFQRDDQRYSLLSPKLLKHIPALMRFLADLRKFRRHFNAMNEKADEYSRHTLIHSDEYLKATYEQCAGDYIAQRGLEDLFQDYIDPLLWASFFHDPRQVSTFFVLAASLPLIIPMFAFEFETHLAVDGFEDSIDLDCVTSLDLTGTHPRVLTQSGERHECGQVVLATPMHITNQLLGSEHSQTIRRGIDVSFYHLRGELKPQYQGRTRNFCSLAEEAVISKEIDGSYLYFYQEDRVAEYFDNWEVITHDRWSPALYFLGSELIHSNPTEHVYIASDHDVPSMENAYLNGRYTAKLLLRDAAAPQHDWTDTHNFEMWSF